MVRAISWQRSAGDAHNGLDDMEEQLATDRADDGLLVDRIYTDLAVNDVTPDGLVVAELAPGISLETVQERTDAPLTAGPGLASEVHTG